ncbi:hypothetical protein, partial [Bowmanella yangjiangensis]
DNSVDAFWAKAPSTRGNCPADIWLFFDHKNKSQKNKDLRKTVTKRTAAVRTARRCLLFVHKRSAADSQARKHAA